MRYRERSGMSEAMQHSPRNNWGATPVPPSRDLMQTYQKGLPVRLIMTPRKKLRTCKPDEPVKKVIDRNKWDFDYFPVVGNRNSRRQIVGLLEIPKHGDEE